MSPAAGLPEAGQVHLACGLGNPGEQYRHTRHNAGAWLVERLAARSGTILAPTARLPVTAAAVPGGPRLAIPTTYMNDSGQAVGPLARYFQVAPANLLVIHDEIDLPPGSARLKFGGGTAGHNGLKDIARVLGTAAFWRLRLGVGHPRDSVAAGERPRPVRDWVLAEPTAAERQAIDAMLDECTACWDRLAAGDMDSAMRRLHQDAAVSASAST